MMYFSCDVGKFLDSKRGTLDIANYNYGELFGIEFGMDKRERILTGASGSSHAMTLMAVDLDENGNPKKWKAQIQNLSLSFLSVYSKQSLPTVARMVFQKNASPI